MSQEILILPTSGDWNNASGWVKDFALGSATPANNTNTTGFNMSWLAYKCGTAILTMVGTAGTARGGLAIGTTMYTTSTINVHPQETTGFTATASDPNSIDLSWTKGIGVDRVVIRGSTSGYPATPQSDTNVYNNTGTGTTHSVSPGETWYYSAWGWNENCRFLQHHVSNRL